MDSNHGMQIQNHGIIMCLLNPSIRHPAIKNRLQNCNSYIQATKVHVYNIESGVLRADHGWVDIVDHEYFVGQRCWLTVTSLMTLHRWQQIDDVVAPATCSTLSCPLNPSCSCTYIVQLYRRWVYETTPYCVRL